MVVGGGSIAVTMISLKMLDRTYIDTITLPNLLRAWRGFLRGKQRRTDVIMFQARLIDAIYLLQQELESKTYVHGGYKRFTISDPKPRIIHKATVRDRLLHHLLYQELYRYFDRHFIFDSYSCRHGKGTHRAFRRFREYAGTVSCNHTKTCWVLKCDVRKFFASIDHIVLKSILAKYIRDGDILWLIEQVIDSFHTEGKPNAGLPLGNITSQLFANIYMNEFDQFAKRQLQACCYVRYADDFVILSQDRMWLASITPMIASFLEEQLCLTLHPQKVSIETYASGVDFLGWMHFPHRTVLRTTTKKRMLKNIRGSVSDATLMSYTGLLQHGNAYGLQLKIYEKRPQLYKHVPRTQSVRGTKGPRIVRFK